MTMTSLEPGGIGSDIVGLQFTQVTYPLAFRPDSPAQFKKNLMGGCPVENRLERIASTFFPVEITPKARKARNSIVGVRLSHSGRVRSRSRRFEFCENYSGLFIVKVILLSFEEIS
jgi:hypothetical protein